MNNMMEFPKTPLEFVESYKFKDSDEIYTNGSELIQVFRVKQMLEHYYEPLKEKDTPKKAIKLKLEPLTNEEYETWWEEYEYRCPNCNYDLFANAENYCGNCGQAIDGSEEE